MRTALARWDAQGAASCWACKLARGQRQGKKRGQQRAHVPRAAADGQPAPRVWRYRPRDRPRGLRCRCRQTLTRTPLTFCPSVESRAKRRGGWGHAHIAALERGHRSRRGLASTGRAHARGRGAGADTAQRKFGPWCPLMRAHAARGLGRVVRTACAHETKIARPAFCPSPRRPCPSCPSSSSPRLCATAGDRAGGACLRSEEKNTCHFFFGAKSGVRVCWVRRTPRAPGLSGKGSQVQRLLSAPRQVSAHVLRRGNHEEEHQ